MYKRITVVAGKTIITRLTDSSRIKTEKGRRPKTNPTPAAVAKINAINQERELTAKLNASFRPNDRWLTLSVDEGTTAEEAMDRIYRFKRGLQRYCAKNELPYRLVETMGIGRRSGKPHFHVILNQEIPWEIITRYWQQIHVFSRPLTGWNYQKIAKYMLKNAAESKDVRGKCKKAFRCSRQVVRPQPKMEVMKRQPASYDIEDLKPRKGYDIDRDSIRAYEHPITGVACLEYIEVSREPEPRIARYSRGKAVPFDPLIPVDWGEQLLLDEYMAAL